jgi:uncharacterized protein with FMN-binding domain
MKRVLATVIGTIVGIIALLGYKTHPPTVRALGASTSVPAPTSSTESPSTTSTVDNSGARATTTTQQSPRTVTGDAVNTRYGAVQVQLTVSGSTISQVSAPEYPSSSNRDLSINNYAIPQLCQEALSAQSAQIDSVSGATYTSNGFISSLQSALSKLG